MLPAELSAANGCRVQFAVSHRTLINQFIHDLQASWPKSVLLAGLFCVGLWFWIPPLYRSIADHLPTTAPPANPAAEPVTLPKNETAAQNQVSPQALPNGVNDHHQSGFTSKTVDDFSLTNPLMQSAEVAGIAGDALRFNYNEFTPRCCLSINRTTTSQSGRNLPTRIFRLMSWSSKAQSSGRTDHRRDACATFINQNTIPIERNPVDRSHTSVMDDLL